MTTPPLSSCCKTPVEKKWTFSNTGTDYFCTSCGKPCSIDHPPASTGHGVEGERPNKLTYKPVNDIGFIVEKKCRLPELKCYEENGSILFYASVLDTADGGREIEALQYLTPEVAMKMAKALEIMAIEAFKKI